MDEATVDENFRIKIKILICRPYSLTVEVVGRS